MQDGVTFKCELNMKLPTPLPYHPRHAAMCLKVDDGSRTILPLLVRKCTFVTDSVTVNFCDYHHGFPC